MKKAIETFRGVIYPSQCDAMGHLNVKEYIGFFDQAEWHCLLQLGFEARRIHHDQIGFADARHVVEYLKELVAGDLVLIESEVMRIGTKSITLFHRMFNASTGALSATQEAVVVQYDLRQRQAVPLLDEVRKSARKRLADEGER